MIGESLTRIPPASRQVYITIGASAGGLEAIHEFFDNMPRIPELSFFIIQHLSPDHKSLLVELVGKHTHMNVFEATDGLHIDKECVYVIPNNKVMTISGGRIRLDNKVTDKAPNLVIDQFLVSLAKDQGDAAIAVILSGTGSDGSKGIKAIKKAGGMVFVQDPITAKFDGMPQSAIATGSADFILPPEMMPGEIYSSLFNRPIRTLGKDEFDEGLLDDIFNLIKRITDLDFQNYKMPTLVRRITNRMQTKGIKTLDDYVHYLYLHQEEVEILAGDFLIGVTRFYRDPAAFQTLCEVILPDLVKAKNDGDILKVWVVACSTGQEAYSIAIELDRICRKLNRELNIKIFATDVSRFAIEQAAANRFSLAIAEEVDETTLEEYFVKEKEYYSLIPAIRKRIVFARHDVAKNPPFINNDLVTCRNMMIYMSAVLQQKVLYTLSFALNKGGYLWLGPSETAGALKGNLLEVDSKWKFYKKTSAKGTPGTLKGSFVPTFNLREEKNVPKADPITADLYKVLTEDLGYVLFYIGSDYQIRESVGDYSAFLSLPKGQLSLNLLQMVPPELSAALNSALRRAWKEERKVIVRNVRVRDKSRVVTYHLTVKPPPLVSGKNGTLIILRREGSTAVAEVDVSDYAAGRSIQYVNELEQELQEAKLNLQAAHEEMETTNEELQSSNEELLSANEELQSSNEELQSVNEELHTLNTEHQIKINELIEINDDLNNYFRSSDIGQVFVDSNLCIRKFNPAISKILKLRESDIGRPLEDISIHLVASNLIEDCRTVIKTAKPIEHEVTNLQNSTFLMRIVPYIRQDKQLDGVVITFMDISRIVELGALNKSVFNSSRNPIIVLQAVREGQNKLTDLKWLDGNHAALALIGSKQADVVTKRLSETLPDLSGATLMSRYAEVIETEQPFHTQMQIKDSWYDMVAVKMMDGVVISLTDFTSQKKAEQKLKKNYAELIGVRENLKKLNTSLEEQVNRRTAELSESEERFRLISEATNDAIWDWNISANTTWWGPSFYSHFGYKEGDENVSRAFWLDKIHPDDRTRVQRSLQDAINDDSRADWNEEYRFLRADGSFANILDRGTIIRDQFAMPYRMLGSMLDVTRLYEAEQKGRISERKFRRVFESNMIGMLFLDQEGRIIDLNEAFSNMVGYAAADLVREKPNLFSLIPARYHDKLKKAKNLLKHDTSSPPMESVLIHRDESTFPVLMGAALLSEEENADMVLYIIDITDQKRAETATKLLMQKKDEFMSIASHELKTPITSMKLSLQVLERLASRETDNQKIHTFIEKANSQSDKLIGLVDDLLNVTKIHAGKMSLDKSEFTLREIIEDGLFHSQHNAPTHRIEVEGNTDVTVFADKHRIEQVLSNFLSNAIKYSPDSDIVRVKVVQSPDFVTVSIIDQGIGVPKDKLAFIFDRFFRVQESSQKFSGLGLGLYICSEIIARHDGKIGVTSEEGKGSTFWFSLPLRGGKAD